MFDMGAVTMQLPLEDKMQYEQGDHGMSFGYVTEPLSRYVPFYIGIGTKP